MQATSLRDEFVLPEFNASLTFYTAATQYQAAGYNLIPLHTQADRAKHPAVAWRQWQSQKISQAELQHWFLELGYTGLGIITGRISGLIVLDFDDPNRYTTFAQQHPELTETYTGQSRRGPHLYFRLPENLTIHSRKGQGVDLLSDGRYVVAPPTTINGHTYSVNRDLPVQCLTPEAVRLIQSFVENGFPPKTTPVYQASTSGQPHQLYQNLIMKGEGRNNALFQAALHARDHGWSRTQVVQQLADLHSQQATPPTHRRETPYQRLKEAQRTIASAFSRPPRPIQSERGVSRYPNAVRETLLNQPDGAVTLRLIEGLRLSGLSAGSTFTEKQACSLLQGLLSRKSIRKALAARYPQGTDVFPPENPPADADPNGFEHKTKKCSLSPGKKETSTITEASARRYTLPTSEQMLAQLGLENPYGDALSLADMGSSKAYRQALHRQLIKRRPGPYGQTLLGNRLGVTDRSIRNYNKAIHIHSSTTWHEIPLSWRNLKRSPSATDLEIPTGGQCLLDDSGKKWPLKREIAAKLLKQGRKVSHLRRGPNYYWYGERPQPSSPAPDLRLIPAEEGDTPKIAPLQVTASAPESPTIASGGVSTGFYVLMATTPATAPQRPANHATRFYRSPLPDAQHEHLAQWVHRDVPDLSLPNARRLVDAYGLAPVEQSLKRLWVLVGKRKLRNPAGFLITASRAAWSRQHGGSAPVFHAQPIRKSRKVAVIPPERDPLWQSEVYRQWRSAFFADLGGAGEELPY